MFQGLSDILVDKACSLLIKLFLDVMRDAKVGFDFHVKLVGVQ